MEPKNEAIQTAIDEIQGLREYIAILSEFPNVPWRFQVFNNVLGIYIPYNDELVAEVEQVLVGLGWEKSADDWQRWCGNRTIDYQRSDHRITIWCQPEDPGSTCSRKIVGYKEQPIYEIACD
jgi:hypothetical protein